MDDKPQNDVMGPRIGEDAAKPRVACPYCKHRAPRVLGLDDFPEEAANEIVAASKDGADFYECRKCKRRWAVMRQRVTRDEDGVASLKAVPGGTNRPGPSGKRQPVRRSVRREQNALARCAIRANLKLAGETLQTVPLDLGAIPDAEERRKARNARKARRRA